MPWLTNAVNEQLQKSVRSRQVLDSLLREVVRSRTEQFAQLEAQEAEKMNEILLPETTNAEAAPADTNEVRFDNYKFVYYNVHCT